METVVSCFPVSLGVQQLLVVAGTIPEHKSLPVSNNSRMLSSLCLSKIYDDLISDQERDAFGDAADAYFTSVD